MKKEENPWSGGILMICTKCGKSISGSLLKESGNPADNLKMVLKKQFKDEGLGGKVRVVTSSCLDICIDDYQAVTWAPVNGKTESFIMHPEKEREELANFIKKAIS
jgi:hypothetical protein